MKEFSSFFVFAKGARIVESSLRVGVRSSNIQRIVLCSFAEILAKSLLQILADTAEKRESRQFESA